MSYCICYTLCAFTHIHKSTNIQFVVEIFTALCKLIVFIYTCVCNVCVCVCVSFFGNMSMCWQFKQLVQEFSFLEKVREFHKALEKVAKRLSTCKTAVSTQKVFWPNNNNVAHFTDCSLFCCERDHECNKSSDKAADLSGGWTAHTGGQMSIGGVIGGLRETLRCCLVTLADEHITVVITGWKRERERVCLCLFQRDW